MTWQLLTGDCVEVMAGMAEASVDAIVTDPPYGLHFMGKTWDQFGGPRGARNTNDNRERGGAMHAGEYDLSVKGQRGFQAEAFRWGEAMLRVLKPGGHLLIFGGTRTYHRLTCALEDAGFEIRDCLAWLYGSGFPKSLDVSKAIDKAAGAEREVVGINKNIEGRSPRANAVPYGGDHADPTTTAPATPDAERWQGWGTALKPAFEPIVLARKPLIGTVAANVLEHGTGALNIDGTRIEAAENVGKVWTRGGNQQGASLTTNTSGRPEYVEAHPSGRWPANVLLDDEAALGLNGAARYFYTPKADRAERNRGLEHRVAVVRNITEGHGRGPVNTSKESDDGIRTNNPAQNVHPTVKPVDLMQWLCRLITPPHGLVLDPFTGSGSTGIAALREGFDFIGIEREPEYVEIARDRIIGDAPLFNVGAEVTA